MKVPSIKGVVAIVAVLGIAAYAGSSLMARGGMFNRAGTVSLEDKLPPNVVKFAEAIPAKTAETLTALPATAARAVESMPAVVPPAATPIRRAVERFDPRPHSRVKAAPATTRASSRSLRAATLAPGRCSALSADEGMLTLRVYQGMTLTDLAVHFSLTADDIRGVNPSLRGGDMLLAGNTYRIPLDHLRVLRHKVRAGDTLSQIVRDIDAPNAFSIRTWNCLPSSELLAGQQLLLFQPRLNGQLGHASY